MKYLAALALAAVLPAFAQPAPAQLLPAQSRIGFTTHQMGVPVQGEFGKYAAAIALDPKKPETGSVSITIDTGSARFGSPELDGEVGKPEWLNVPKFPQASFKSISIKAAGPGRYEVTGTLTIKGAAHPLVVPVQLVRSGANSIASGSFKIGRLDYKVGEGEWTDTSMLANEIEVSFKLALAGLAAP